MGPLIGITCGYEYTNVERFYCNRSYVKSIEMAGGTPILFPALENKAQLSRLVDMVDGILLPGGYDLDPITFGEEPLPGLGVVDPVRDELELTVCRMALERNQPILGICRGLQLLNVAAGGRLYQDLPSQAERKLIQHRQTAPRWFPSHEITIASGSVLKRIFNGISCLRVNSFHHQAVKDVAPGLVVTAVAKDGVIEAIESPTHKFVLGVQWHPEVMWETAPEQAAIFRAFVEAAMT